MVGRRQSGRQGRDTDDGGITERVVKISRVSKVHKGGRHLSFSALVVVGDGEGRVGLGLGKALAVPDAVRKGGVNARKNMIKVPLTGSTIPHEIVVRYGAAEIADTSDKLKNITEKLLSDSNYRENMIRNQINYRPRIVKYTGEESAKKITSLL